MDGVGPISPQSEPNNKATWPMVRLPCPLCAMPIEVFPIGGPVQVTCESCSLISTLETPLPVVEEEIELVVEPPREEPRPTDDMSRWLAGDPIQYFPGSAYKQLQRFCKQNTLVANCVLAASALLVVGLLTFAWGYLDAQIELAQVQRLSQNEILDKQQHLLELQLRLQQQEQRQLEAERQRQLAEREALVMKSKYLAAQANALLASNPRRSAQFAVEAANATLCRNEPLLPDAHQPLRNLLSPIDGIRLKGHADEIISLAISTDSRWLASGDAEGQVLLWDLMNPSRPAASAVLGAHQGRINDMLFSNDNRWLVTGSQDATVCLWDMMAADPTAKPWKLKGGDEPVYALAMSPDSRWLVTGGGDELFDAGTARLWDLSAGVSAATSTELKRDTGPIRTVAISPNNRWLALGVDEAARLWDLSTRHPTVASLVLQGHAGTITCATFTEDNRWLVTCGRDHRGKDCIARLWDLSSEYHSESVVLGGHKGAIRAIAASPDSRWLVTGGDGRMLRVWDLKASDPSAKSRVLSQTPGDIHSIAISRDNRWLAVGGVTGRVHLWSMSEQGPCELPVAIDTGNDHLNAMAFSPDSQWLATAGSERSVRLWNMNIDLMLLQAVKIATSNEPSPWPQTFSEIQRTTRFSDTRVIAWSQLAEGIASQEQSKNLSSSRKKRAQRRSRTAQHAEHGRPLPQTWEQAAMDYTLGEGRSGSFATDLAREHSMHQFFSESTAATGADPFNPLRINPLQIIEGSSSRTEKKIPATAQRHFRVNPMRSK